jgi:RNA 2',3'-cyclic 3'-phosphodiesterase
MRRFIAIPLPAGVRQNIEDILKSFRDIEGIKPVKKSNLHLTLAFLGDSGSESQFGKLREISFSPFTLTTTSIELFPAVKPRLVWIELDKPPGLSDLHRKITAIFGIEEELRAHITIIRIKRLTGENKKILKEITGKLNPFKITFNVNQFSLYNSELKPDGPDYRVVESFSAAPGS